MRHLGDASIQSYRWDVVYLHGSLLADEDSRVTALAPTAEAMLAEIKVERDHYEQAEEADVAATAVRGRRDAKLDRAVITFGGVTRAISDVIYKRFFSRLSPSRLARRPIDDEMLEVSTVLAQLAELPADDALRTAHEPPVRDALASLQAAKTAENDADVALSVAKARLTAFKARMDRQRVELYGQLVAIVGSKSTADTYFRPTTSAPQGGDAPPPPADGPVSPATA